MDEILAQLGELIIGSVPTALLFLVLVMAFYILVQKPLSRTIEERRNRTIGAVENAHEAILAADTKAQEYESKLRQAPHGDPQGPRAACTTVERGAG